MARYPHDFTPPPRRYPHDYRSAEGYRGPGTDLGEDIRRGHVGRAGYRGPRWEDLHPHQDRYADDYYGGSWGRALREGWDGMRRTRPRPY